MDNFEIKKNIDTILLFEAKRIINLLLDMYNQDIKVNKNFNILVFELIKDDYKFYKYSILEKVVSLIPSDLLICPSGETIFITIQDFEALKKITRNSKSSSNKKIIDNLSKSIIDNYTKKNYKNNNILEIIYNEISKNNVKNITSENIIFIVENIIMKINQSYEVTSINPLIIKGLSGK